MQKIKCARPLRGGGVTKSGNGGDEERRKKERKSSILRIYTNPGRQLSMLVCKGLVYQHHSFREGSISMCRVVGIAALARRR